MNHGGANSPFTPLEHALGFTCLNICSRTEFFDPFNRSSTRGSLSTIQRAHQRFTLCIILHTELYNNNSEKYLGQTKDSHSFHGTAATLNANTYIRIVF
jgi:hypothetical protein